MVHLLITAVIAASAAGSRSPIDLGELRARTKSYEDALAAGSRPADPSAAALSRLESAQRLGGEIKGWGRLRFPPARSETELEARARAGDEVDRALVELGSAADRLLGNLDAADRSAGSAESRARVSSSRRLLTERLAEVNELGARASAGFRAGSTFGQRLAQYLRRLAWRDPETALARLRERVSSWRTPADILGAELNYVLGGMSAPVPPSGSVLPAYADPNASPLALEDTTQGREVDLSPGVVAKARELGSAPAAFEFVHNQMRLEWYYGSLKDSTETLREGRGNDADLSALLIALLRAQGIPARFVRGTIVLPAPKLAGLMGLLSVDQATALDAAARGGAPFVLDPATRDIALRALGAAGIPYEPIATGGQVGGVRLLHVWVEAYVPYSDYRGTANTPEGKQWIALDPAVPGITPFAATAPSLDLLNALNATPASLTDDFLAHGGALSLLEFVQSRAQDYLSANRPDLHYAQLLRTVTQRPESLRLLPGSLPYQVESVLDEGAFLPEQFKHRVHLTVGDASGAALDVTLSAHQLVGHRAVLTYKPATQADLDVVQQSGGLYAAPPALVQLVPALTVDGRQKAIGGRSAALGDSQTWQFEMLLPDGSTRRIENRIIAGNTIALGMAGPKNGFVEPAQPDSADLDGAVQKFLYRVAAQYANEWTEGEEELARLLSVVPVRPTANVVFVGSQLQVEQVLGVNTAVHWKGLEIDADLRTMVPVELAPGRGPALLRLSGYQGSTLEASVLAGRTGVTSISSTGVLQEAARQGVPVLRITPQNAGSQLPALSTGFPAVAKDVRDQIARGREVLVPQFDLSILDWTGTGYIVRDPVTEEGGYFLAGGVAGGQTVVSPGSWSDAELVAQLSQPQLEAVTDYANSPGAVARIVKDPSTDLQQRTVGKGVRVAAFVTTIGGQPIRNAPVTFRRAGAAKPEFALTVDGARSAVLQTTTGPTGRAEVWAFPDTDIRPAALLLHGTPFDQLAGQNLITADTCSGPTSGPVGSPVCTGTTVILANPFIEIGLPDFDHPKVTLGAVTTFTSPPALDVGADFPMSVTDQFDNPLANQTVRWRQTPSTGAFLDANVGPKIAVLGASSPPQSAQLDQTTSTFGIVVMGYIPGPVPGPYTVTGMVNVNARQVSGTYTVNAVATNNYQLRAAYTRQIGPDGQTSSLDGIFGLRLPGPIAAQVLKSTVDAGGAVHWSPIRGDEPDLRQAQISMDVVNAADGTPVAVRESQLPLDIPIGPTAPFDDDRTVVFWPKYLLKNGTQTVVVSASVVGTDNLIRCCSDVFRLTIGSSQPVVTVHHAFPGFADVPSIDGTASANDSAIGFAVRNPSASPLFGELAPIAASDTIVVPPDPQAQALLSGHPSAFLLLENATTTRLFPTLPGTAGGILQLNLYARDPTSSFGSPILLPTKGAAYVLGPGAVLARGPVLAKLILPVRNLGAATQPGQPAGTRPLPTTEPPIPIPGRLTFIVDGNGTVTVTSGLDLIAGGRQLVDAATGAKQITSISGPPATPILDPITGTLTVSIPPGDPFSAPRDVTITFTQDTPAPGTDNPIRRTLQLITKIESGSSRPIGHTFVKNVSVVDGHLQRQSADLAVPGRGPQLSLSRSYSSATMGGSPLGPGWDHNYRSYVVVPGDGRYLITGGDGSGQVFTCGFAGCTTQRGYNGTLRVTPDRVVFRSKSGTEFRYGQPDDYFLPGRAQLQSITDPSGNVVRLLYGKAETGHEVQYVVGAGGTRFLQFFYAQLGTAQQPMLTDVELNVSTGSGNAAPAGTSAGVCIHYTYDVRQRLSAAARLDGPCGNASPVLRQETYAYREDSPREDLQDNLISWTDANGNVTSYKYGATKGTADVGGDPEEMVGSVVEAAPGGTTTFSYGNPSAGTVLGDPVRSETDVQFPVPGMPPTRYLLNAYGNATRVVRPVTATVAAVTSTLWNPDNVRVQREDDACGRTTSYDYDGFGNVIGKHVVPPPPGSACGLDPLTDGDGNPVNEVVEHWDYDRSFAIPRSHTDSAGRVTVFCLDSQNADPRSNAVTGTGLLLETRRYATPPADVSGACAGPAPSDAIVTRNSYCGVGAVACPIGGVKGDLAKTVDPNGNTTEIVLYDRHGDVQQKRQSISVTTNLVTTLLIDDRGRTYDESDSLGHHTVRQFDGLDRVHVLDRRNTKGTGLVRTTEYYPAGQIASETNGLGLKRTVTLDGQNHPATISELGGGVLAPRVTVQTYDAQGSLVSTVDARGVVTTTTYDFANRPTQIAVRAPLDTA